MGRAEALAESYEIRVYREGPGWVPGGTFAEAADACAEARARAAEAGILAVKVIEERFLEEEKLLLRQTIYRSGGQSAGETRRLERPGRRDRKPAAQSEVRKRRRRTALRHLRSRLALAMELAALWGGGLLLYAWVLAQS